MSTAVVVCVRSRPLSHKEIRECSKSIIEMEGKSTKISDPTGKLKPLTFTFDNSFWSTVPDDSHFIGQEGVYNTVGTILLDNAFSGYNACLFAYGQTGSGKTYSMMGYGEDKGVVPRLCNSLFERSNAKQTEAAGNWNFHVEVSYLEIYNEKSRCLLDSEVREYKVREHPSTGPYVENLTKVVVKTFDDIERIMDEGNKTRTVACTNMNATSSRSHAIFSIVFTQKTKHPELNAETEMVSKINLVDLAGSERADRTGASGATLKEGSNINKSLTTLGKVISALADGGAKGKKHIPFRDSTLTWLLKENLMGNSKTIMLAALSPADSNYDETVSTLRYADRAKQLKTAAVVNEDPGAKKIRELMDEIEKLKAIIERTSGGGGPSTSPRPGPDGTTSPSDPSSPRGEYQLMAPDIRLKQTQDLLKEQTVSFEEKAEESEKKQKERRVFLDKMGIGVSVSKAVPSLVNLNEDPLMSECLMYCLKLGENKVGSADGNDIILNGKGIEAHHALLRVEKKEGSEDDELTTTVEPKGATCAVRINGRIIGMSAPLNQGDRIIIGEYHVFRYSNPTQAQAKRASVHRDPTAGKTEDGEASPAHDFHRALEERFEAEKEAWFDNSPEVQKMRESFSRRQRENSFLRTEAQRRASESEALFKTKLLGATHITSSTQGSAPAPSQDIEKQTSTSSIAQKHTAMAQMVCMAGAKAQRLPPQQIFRFKIVLLGHQEVGKTSLRKCFQSDPMFFKRLPDVLSTTGIEMVTKSIKHETGENLDVTIMDFAGQEMYHSHSTFLTDRTIFGLVWKVSAVDQDFMSTGISAFEEDRICKWVAEVYAKFPNAKIILIATHLDELRDQTQSTVEFILNKVQKIVENFAKTISLPNEDPIEVVGNFAASCKNRTFVGAGRYRALSGQKLSSLLKVICTEGYNCLQRDEFFFGGAIPGRHIRVMKEIEAMQKANEKLLLPLAEFVHMAVRNGVENDHELLKLAQLLHSWSIIHLFNQSSLDDNVFLFLHPAWLCRMAGVLFSFAHVIHTPDYLRRIIGGIEYSVDEALYDDCSLFEKGFLRFPVARVLFGPALRDLQKREPTDEDVGMCMQLLLALELCIPVELRTSSDPRLEEEIPSFINWRREGGTPPPTVTRYFVPSLSPFSVPRELKACSDLLFNLGHHRCYHFNMFPDEVWFRLIFRLSDHVARGLEVQAPTDEEPSDLMQANELHARWKDGMWLGELDKARILLLREAKAVRLYSAEEEGGDSDNLMEVVNTAINELLREYHGIQSTMLLPCPTPTCTAWHSQKAMAKAFASDDKSYFCIECRENFTAEALRPRGGITRQASSEMKRNTMELIRSALDNSAVVEFCCRMGITTGSVSSFNSNTDAKSPSPRGRSSLVNTLFALDKVVRITMLRDYQMHKEEEVEETDY